jgi:hypothetical protein
MVKKQRNFAIHWLPMVTVGTQPVQTPSVCLGCFFNYDLETGGGRNGGNHMVLLLQNYDIMFHYCRLLQLFGDAEFKGIIAVLKKD